MLHAKTKPSRVGQKKRTKGEHLKGNNKLKPILTYCFLNSDLKERKGKIEKFKWELRNEDEYKRLHDSQ